MRRFALLALIAAACSEPAAPETPLPLSPDGVGTSARTGEIVIFWRDVSQDETSYRVEIRDSAGGWVLFRETPANTTTVVHTGVTHNVTYQYRIAACNANGCSAWVEATGKWQGAIAPTFIFIAVNTLRPNSANLIASAYSGGLTTRFVFTLTKAGSTDVFFRSEAIEGFVTGGESELGRPATGTFPYHGLEPATDYVLSATASNVLGSATPIPPISFRTPAS